jgi:hypothetical protein
MNITKIPVTSSLNTTIKNSSLIQIINLDQHIINNNVNIEFFIVAHVLLKYFIFCTEMAEYMNYVRRLGFNETPDYVYLRNLFITALHKNGFEDDQCFDWKDKPLVFYLKLKC